MRGSYVLRSIFHRNTAAATRCKRVFNQNAFTHRSLCSFTDDEDDCEDLPVPESPVIATHSITNFDPEADTNKFFALTQEDRTAFFPEAVTKRLVRAFDLIGYNHIMLRKPTAEILSVMKNWNQFTQSDRPPAYILDGARGTGKSLALLQIVHFARANNWIVLYVPRARSWCFRAPYVIPSTITPSKFDIDLYGQQMLKMLAKSHHHQLLEIPLRNEYGDRYYPTEKFEQRPKTGVKTNDAPLTLADIVEVGIREEDLACPAVVDLRAELNQVEEFPVLIAIDEFSSWYQDTIFGFDGKPVYPSDISVVDALLDVGPNGYLEDRKLKNGLFIGATTDRYPSKVKLWEKINFKEIRKTFGAYGSDEMESVLAYYTAIRFLVEEMTPAEIAHFQLMTKSNPGLVNCVCLHAHTEDIKAHSANVINAAKFTFGSRFSCVRAKTNNAYENATYCIQIFTLCAEIDQTTVGTANGRVSSSCNPNSGAQCNLFDKCEINTTYFQKYFRGVLCRMKYYVRANVNRGIVYQSPMQKYIVMRNGTFGNTSEFHDFTATRIQSWYRMQVARRRYMWKRFSVYPIAAFEIQIAWRKFHLEIPKPQISAYVMASQKIQNCWKSYRSRQQFQYYSSLLKFENTGDPIAILRAINPVEAKFLDASMSAHVRFRLGGFQFPPTIYYKIFTRSPICDLNAFSPKDYTKTHVFKTPQRKYLRVGNAFFRVRQSEQRTRNWYKRLEQNGWRPVSVKCIGDACNDSVSKTTAAQLSRSKLQYNKIPNGVNLRKLKKKKQINWMVKLYQNEKEKESKLEAEDSDFRDADEMIDWR
uniref:Uncharacterized protein AlNc14C294G10282 n=1 Tax=Albugo laibachii Nc14 TaxID=890382 RepID=F0WVE1_9STRA|nr:conserved hypothetical protein [Albugo laibachii Nc14]|eukprot:CCA25380.1 conserved hypothetical protein [Albugo laibachii Nc14]